MEDRSKAFKEALRPLTVYLGESGKAHDSNRVDILPPGNTLAISVSTSGVRISNISGSDPEVLWSIEYDDLLK